MRHLLSVLVENAPGVLSRVTGLISRRGFNIRSLSVAPTQDQGRSRMTIVVEADDVGFEQLCKQLHKLVSVYKISDLTGRGSVERELMLAKVSVGPERRHEVVELAQIFRAQVIDVGDDSLTVEAGGTPDKLAALEGLLAAFGIRQLTRTGAVAMARAQAGA